MHCGDNLLAQTFKLIKNLNSQKQLMHPEAIRLYNHLPTHLWLRKHFSRTAAPADLSHTQACANLHAHRTSHLLLEISQNWL